MTEELEKLFKSKDIEFDSGVCIKQAVIDALSVDDDNFARELTRLLKLTVQMRNSRIGKQEDWLISPIADVDGNFFDSTKNNKTIPKNSDANGAYHIALKSLYLLKNKQFNDCYISLANWFNDRQE